MHDTIKNLWGFYLFNSLTEQIPRRSAKPTDRKAIIEGPLDMFGHVFRSKE